jgi:DNA-directed RNA polymerase I subunit RPA43
MGKRKTDDTLDREERKRIKKEKRKLKKSKHKTDNDGGVFLQKRLEFAVSLLPAALANVKNGIRGAMRKFLLKYNDGVGGIMLAYDNLTILSDVQIPGLNQQQGAVAIGEIRNEMPHIHYKVLADVLVFCPYHGCNLHGVVTESFSSHLSLVVHHFFNACISADDMRESGFEFDDVQSQWFWKETSNSLSKNDGIDFICENIYEAGGIVSIDGKKPTIRAKEV